MAKQDSTYNGWRNYQTWCCNLWLTNEAGLDSMIREHISELDSSDDVADVAQYLEQLIDEFAPALPASLYLDLLTAAISEIDFFEIAESYLTA